MAGPCYFATPALFGNAGFRVVRGRVYSTASGGVDHHSPRLGPVNYCNFVALFGKSNAGFRIVREPRTIAAVTSCEAEGSVSTCALSHR